MIVPSTHRPSVLYWIFLDFYSSRWARHLKFRNKCIGMLIWILVLGDGHYYFEQWWMDFTTTSGNIPDYSRPLAVLSIHNCCLWRSTSVQVVRCWITWFISSWEESNCCQTLANSQNNNYFHPKWSKVVILSENSCPFFNLLSFGNSYLFSSQLDINHVIQ